jgi:hypothetical protein
MPPLWRIHDVGGIHSISVLTIRCFHASVLPKVADSELHVYSPEAELTDIANTVG